MKKNHFNRHHIPYLTLTILTGILCLVMPNWILAQPNLTVDNTSYPVIYSGTYEDFTVPGNAARIILNLKGGDGGKARVRYSDGLAITNTCNADGGEGATVAATFAVGNGAGKIPAGSTIRFIVGGVGESGNTNNTFAGWQTGGGGGATGILYKAPGMSNFEPLAIAGGGGGAYRGIALGFCVDDSPGRGGNYGPNGDGGGGDIDPGGGGSNGNGGSGNELAGGGGGGYLSDGDGVTCVGLTSSFGVVSNEAGEGHKADDTGSPGGTSEGCTAFAGWENGGYGYGSGGSGSDVGGGGGGYSGGGKGGTTGGGGGGGSYVNSIRLSESGSDGGNTGSPENGTASYLVIPRPDNDLCGSARILTCGSTVTGSTEYATNDDAPSACGTASKAEGVWFKFLGNGDVMTLSGAGSSFTPKISVYIGNCGALTCIGGDINAYTLCTGRLATYYVYLDGAPLGNYQIGLTCSSTPPSITCPTSFSKNTDPNQCTAIVTYDVTASDNCAVLSKYRTAGLPSGAVFPKGPTTITWEAIDNAFNSTACSFTVTVVDNQAPVMTCPSISRSNDPGQCGATVSYVPNILENCPNPVLTVTSGLPSGSFFPIGSSTVNLKVTDGANLMATCSFSVTITDNENPVITCPANIIRPTDIGTCAAVVNYATPTASDNCSVSSINLVTPSQASGTSFQKGVSSVVWEAADGAGRTARCTFTVTVEDTQAPNITCPANMIVGNAPSSCNANVSYATPAVSDNCNLPSNALTWVSGGTSHVTGSPNSSATFAKGQTTVIWRVTDAAGLTRTCSFRVIVNDTEAPTFTNCPSGQTVNATTGQCSAVITYTTPTATDNCAPAPVVTRISGFPSASAFPVGNSTVIWRAIDGAGRSSTCSFVVAVADNQQPTITCPQNITQNNPANACSTPVVYAPPSSSDNCGINATFLVSGLASGSVFPLGTTTNVWRAVDNNGLSSTCSMTVTVICGTIAAGQGASERNASLKDGHGVTLLVAPNPATQKAQITVSNLGEAGGVLTLFDMQGRAIAQYGNLAADNTWLLDLEDLSSGVYLLALRTDQGAMITKRLVKRNN